MLPESSSELELNDREALTKEDTRPILNEIMPMLFVSLKMQAKLQRADLLD